MTAEIPDSIGPEVDRDLLAKDIEFVNEWKALGIPHDKVIEYIDFNQPFVKENFYYYISNVSLKIQFCDRTTVQVLRKKDLPNVQTMQMDSQARISAAYYAARSSAKQTEKLQRKQYFAKIQAAEKLLRSFPAVVRGLKENGKQIVDILAPTAPKNSGV